MMGYRHIRDDLLVAAADVVGTVGIGALTYRLVADRLGIADRTVVYYFPTKDDLVGAVLQVYAARLRGLLDAAVAPGRQRPADLLAAAWPALTTDVADAAFRVYVEVMGLAATGREPFRTLSVTVATAWVDWLEARVSGPVAGRRDAAAGLLAQLDGLLLLRQVAGPDVAGRAARGMRVTTGR